MEKQKLKRNRLLRVMLLTLKNVFNISTYLRESSHIYYIYKKFWSSNIGVPFGKCKGWLAGR